MDNAPPSAAPGQGDINIVRPEERAGLLAVPMTRATGFELETVLDSLEHPPAKPKVIASLASAASAGLVVLKAYNELTAASKVDVKTLAFFAMGLVLSVTSLVLLIIDATKQHPHHERAKQYVREMIRLQGRSPQPAKTNLVTSLLAMRSGVMLIGAALIVWRPEILAWPVAMVLIATLAAEVVIRLISSRSSRPPSAPLAPTASQVSTNALPPP